MIKPLLVALCAFAFPVLAQTQSAAPAASEAAPLGTLELARSGNEVMITWTLPHSEVRQLEIFRNTSKEPKGRGRAAAVRSEPTLYIDQVPDLNVTYWYWLKVTLHNGQVVNIGPVATPNPVVWTP